MHGLLHDPENRRNTVDALHNALRSESSSERARKFLEHSKENLSSVRGNGEKVPDPLAKLLIQHALTSIPGSEQEKWSSLIRGLENERSQGELEVGTLALKHLVLNTTVEEEDVAVDDAILERVNEKMSHANPSTSLQLSVAMGQLAGHGPEPANPGIDVEGLNLVTALQIPRLLWS
ncbi:hypothetical protein K469DRAFT_769313 [Zopfia rhizophila CBS 207.26]|uniref:Uncharacterized protein n=1 Tax=Zopfia rhizophila CBS 207.26 TaxID=1314779 RepID=A0A6A6DBA8_9PEZI|nr:hypothetical protein K469DRAFT_769313 [Zopfia rhizophila CBS 207.26]